MSAPAAWKPPYWLLALDIAGVALLGMGLHSHFAGRSSALAQALNPVALPLMIVGGLMIAAGSVLAVVTLLKSRRRG